MKRLALLLALLPAAASAQDYVMPRIPSEAEKVEALKLGYRLNGNSMVRCCSSIDLTDPAVLKADRIVTTITIGPEVLPPVDADPNGGVWPKLELQPRLEKQVENADICRRHGLRKVVSGSSWRCRK